MEGVLEGEGETTLARARRRNFVSSLDTLLPFEALAFLLGTLGSRHVASGILILILCWGAYMARGPARKSRLKRKLR